DGHLVPTAEGPRGEARPGFGPFKRLVGNPEFVLACQVKGLENVVRYGLVTWIPLYYFEAAGLQLKSTILFTLALPIGYVLAPLCAGVISDRLLRSARRPMVLLSAAASGPAPLGLSPVRATQ